MLFTSAFIPAFGSPGKNLITLDPTHLGAEILSPFLQEPQYTKLVQILAVAAAVDCRDATNQLQDPLPSAMLSQL